MGAIEIRDVVTAFLLRHALAGPRLFVVRRSGRVGTYRGRWSAISGYLEEAPEAQARRELAEETGLGSGDVALVAAGTCLTVEDAALSVRWRVHPFLFEIVTANEPALDWENVEGRWVEPWGLASMDTVPGLAEALDRVLSPALAGYPAQIIAAVEQLRVDRSSGAAALARQAARALVEAVERGADPVAAAAALSMARPSMAPLAAALRRLLAMGPSAASLRALEAEWEADHARLATEAADVLPPRVLTLSASASVMAALLARRPDLTLVAESRPLLEGRATAQALAAADLAVELVVDAAVAAALPAVDAVVLGADTLLADGSAVNKVGSLPLALAAREAERPVYVVTDTAKLADRTWFVIEEMPPEEVWPDAPRDIHVRNPYFERVPPDLIAGIITERGLIAPADAGALAREATPPSYDP